MPICRRDRRNMAPKQKVPASRRYANAVPPSETVAMNSWAAQPFSAGHIEFELFRSGEITSKLYPPLGTLALYAVASKPPSDMVQLPLQPAVPKMSVPQS